MEVDPDDGITIYCAIADPGEGNDSMLSQIAAHLLGIPLSKVRRYTRATDRTEAMGPAASSRMTFMGGGALSMLASNSSRPSRKPAPTPMPLCSEDFFVYSLHDHRSAGY